MLLILPHQISHSNATTLQLLLLLIRQSSKSLKICCVISFSHDRGQGVPEGLKDLQGNREKRSADFQSIRTPHHLLLTGEFTDSIHCASPVSVHHCFCVPLFCIGIYRTRWTSRFYWREGKKNIVAIEHVIH